TAMGTRPRRSKRLRLPRERVCCNRLAVPLEIFIATSKLTPAGFQTLLESQDACGSNQEDCERCNSSTGVSLIGRSRRRGTGGCLRLCNILREWFGRCTGRQSCE